MSNDDVLAAQIKSSIITKIKTQEYLPGELLPSERDFATMYSVSRYLIHDIFDELISQHYLIRVQGKGTFVRKPEQNRVALGVLNESKNASFTSLVRNFGIEISNKCLGTGIIKNKKYFADKLNETMMMVEAGEKLQKHLHLPSATSIVNYIEFIGYDENGNLVEYTESYSRPDKLEVRFGTNDI
ncbi:MAG: GntR family transcriptional regulator [Clostridiales bacterium]|nr:GntR family transcriptional regulator [Clostridiales bacterium]